MRFRFTKMHGLGNDFVVIDAISQRVRMNSELAQKIAHRQLGIGCDQILLVEAPTRAETDFRYRIFNADGSEVENCGNGARCFAKFVIDKRLTGKKTITVETRGGIITLNVLADGQVTVNMGIPKLAPSAIPFEAHEQQIAYQIDTHQGAIMIGAASMGNPHAVLTVDDVKTAPVGTLGPEIGKHSKFLEGANVGFMAIRSANEIDLRVFERGSGETLACGTGACAAVVVGRLQHQLAEKVAVNLPGGTLHIEWQGDQSPVMMTGPATTVFQGQIKL